MSGKRFIKWLIAFLIFLTILIFASYCAGESYAQSQTPDFSSFTPVTFTPGTHTGLGLVQLLLALKGDSDSLISGIDARQAYNLTSTGRYFQILQDNNNLPADGALNLPNRWTDQPTDQLLSLSNIRLLSGPTINLPFAFAIDAYDGPSGKGYVLRFMVVIQNNTYERDINHGPETWREKAWSKITIDP
jgi:hypothetical protein